MKLVKLRQVWAREGDGPTRFFVIAHTQATGAWRQILRLTCVATTAIGNLHFLFFQLLLGDVRSGGGGIPNLVA